MKNPAMPIVVKYYLNPAMPIGVKYYLEQVLLKTNLGWFHEKSEW